MDSSELRERTKRFCLKAITLFNSLPEKPLAHVLGKQMLRSATSLAANYRAACRSRSRSEFVAKMSVVVEEADETLFWLEIIEESRVASVDEALILEAKQLLYIMSSSRKTARDKLDAEKEAKARSITKSQNL